MKKDEGLIIRLKISPNASKNEIIRSSEGIKIKITAQPIDGKANKCLVEFISKKYKIPKSSIEIVRGETSKEKTILIKNLDNDKLEIIQSELQ